MSFDALWEVSDTVAQLFITPPETPEAMREDTEDIESVLASRFESFDLRDVPESTKDMARLVVLDTVGISIYGSHRGYVADVLAATERYGMGLEGHGAVAHATWDRHAPTLAAEANATAASSTECYSGLQGAGMGSIYVVSAALAMGEHLGSSGRAVLEAVVVGYEVAAIVGDLLRPFRGDLQGHGGNLPVGVAATVASLRNFDREEFANALRIAANPLIIGSWDAIVQGASVRNYYTGLSLTHGIRAAMLAEAGVTGMKHANERHLFETLSLNPPDDGSVEAGVDRFGEEYYLDETIFKMHPSCRYTHAPLEALEAICTENDIHPGDIDSVAVHTTEFATYGEITRPESAVDAKYSIPYVLGAFLARGSVGVSEFRSDAVRDEEILSQAEKVRVEADPAYEARAADGLWGSAVEVETTEGAVIRIDVYDAESGVDVGEAELVEKFETMLSHRGGPFDVDRLRRDCLGIDRLDTVRSLFDE